MDRPKITSEEHIATLTRLFQQAHNAKDALAFLRSFGEYMDYFTAHSELGMLMEMAKRQYAKFASEQLSEEILGKQNPDINEFFSEDVTKKYATYQYEQLKKYYRFWKVVRSMKTLKQIRNTKILHTDKDEYGESSGVASGAYLTDTTKHFSEHLNIFHHKIVADLKWIIDHGVASPELAFNKKNGMLHFQGKEIAINDRKILTNAHHLLAYMFNDKPFEQHFYGEMEEEVALLEHKTPKSYYDACKIIEKKVAEATGTADFLNYSSGKKMYVQVNPKYNLKTYP